MDDQFGFITANPSVPISIEKVDSNTGIHYIHLKATRCKMSSYSEYLFISGNKAFEVKHKRKSL